MDRTVIERLERRESALYWLLAAYFALNVVVRLLTSTSLELDEGEQLFFAQGLALGYSSQPPFYNWLQYCVVQLLGNSVASLTLLKNVMLFLSYVFLGLAAQIMLRNRALAIAATLGMIVIPQIGYEAQRDLTHTVALLFSCTLFIYTLARTLDRPTAVNYALTGVAVGIGVLSKYNFVLLPAAALLALVSDSSLRGRLFDPRVLLTIAIAGVIVAPHGLWFIENISDATHNTLQKLHGGEEDISQIRALLSLAKAIVAIGLPVVAIFIFAFGRSVLHAWAAQTIWTRLLGRLLVAGMLLLLALVLTGVAEYIRHRWLIPLFFLVPLYLAAKLDAAGGQVTDTAKRRYGTIVAAIMVFIPALLLGRPIIGGMLGEYGKQNIPYGQALTSILASGKDRPAAILAGDVPLAGNIRLHEPGIAVIAPGFEHFAQTAVFDATHPLLILWRSNHGKPDPGRALRGSLTRLPGFQGQELEIHDAAIPYRYGRDGDFYHLGYIWIYPKQAQ